MSGAGGSRDEPSLRIGVVGLGRAFSLMATAFQRHRHSRLVAGADPRPEARFLFSRDFDAPAYETIEELCRDDSVNVVYVATPHPAHAGDAEAAARAGKHVLVEKPMALSLEECRRMIVAARRANVRLLVGHSHSFDAPIARTRQIVASGAYGALKMVTALNFTDFLYRPRRAEELDTARGGGVLFNQAPHQVDVLRLLGGGRLASVFASVGRWDDDRPTEGAYSALFRFENGAFATVTYSGYAHFDSDALCQWTSELGEPKDEANYGSARRALKDARAHESEFKRSRIYGGERFGTAARAPSAHEHFGFVVASCEHADLRPTPTGVAIYADEETRFETCPLHETARGEVVDELYRAVCLGEPPIHDGAWGLATMEACLGILASARQGREIALTEQSGMRDG